MNLGESLATLIDFVREHGGEARPEIRKALKRVEQKREVLRIKAVAHSYRHACPRCRANCSGVVCWRCWSDLPEALRRMFEGARTEQGKREAMRAVLEYVRRESGATV